MKNIIEQLKIHFPHLRDNILYHTDVCIFEENTESTKQEYNISIIQESFIIKNFDKHNKKSRLKHCGDKQPPCVDILVSNTQEHKLIELKTTINKDEISGLFGKFYYGYLEAQALLSIFPNETKYKFIVIYTDDKTTENPDSDSDPYLGKATSIDKKRVKEWKKCNLINELTDTKVTPLIEPFTNELLPITKILYDTSTNTPIDLDSY